MVRTTYDAQNLVNSRLRDLVCVLHTSDNDVIIAHEARKVVEALQSAYNIHDEMGERLCMEMDLALIVG